MNLAALPPDSTLRENLHASSVGDAQQPLDFHSPLGQLHLPALEVRHGSLGSPPQLGRAVLFEQVSHLVHDDVLGDPGGQQDGFPMEIEQRPPCRIPPAVAQILHMDSGGRDVNPAGVVLHFRPPPGPCAFAVPADEMSVPG